MIVTAQVWRQTQHMTMGPVPLISLAATSLLALAACSSGASNDTVEISFQSKFNERAVMDASETGSSLGDYIPGSGDLLDADGAVIGQFDVHSFVTRTLDDAEGRLVTAEYSFGEEGADSFIIMGAEHFLVDGGLPDPNRLLSYAVVGGTGIYNGANGQCNVQRTDEIFTTDCVFTVKEAS